MSRVSSKQFDIRRESILDAAAKLFAEKGISSATMADIAAESGLSAGAIYRYFSSKNELLRAVFDAAAQRNHELFQTEFESARSPFAALENIGRRFWIDVDDRDARICEVQMALTAARDPEDFGVVRAQYRKTTRALLEQTIRSAQQAGEIDSSIDPSSLAVLLQATTDGMQFIRLERIDDIDFGATLDLMARMIRHVRAES